MEPENYLRLRSEDVIVLAEEAAGDVTAPSAEVVATALQDLFDAALALCGVGLLAPSRAEAVLAETAEALAVRGVDWLVTALPELPALHGSGPAAPTGRLERVVAVGRVVPAAGGARVLTSLECWSDRGILRFVGDDGMDSVCELTPAPGPSAGAMIVEMTEGCAVTIELGDAVEVAPLASRATRAGAALYLEWLAWQQLAAVRRDPTVETMNEARGRLEAAAGALAGLSLVGHDRDRIAVAGAFDAALVGAGLVEPTVDVRDPPPEWARMVQPPAGPAGIAEVVAVAGQLPADDGGWAIASVEDWADHWRLVASGFPDSPGCIWTAVDDDGRTYAGGPVTDFAIRFDPGLRPGWRTLSVSVLEVGRVRSLDIHR